MITKCEYCDQPLKKPFGGNNYHENCKKLLDNKVSDARYKKLKEITIIRNGQRIKIPLCNICYNPIFIKGKVKCRLCELSEEIQANKERRRAQDDRRKTNNIKRENKPRRVE